MTEVEFQCVRWATTEPRLPAATMPCSTGNAVAEKICATWWHEWIEAKVMVINELRLHFMEPTSLEVLEQQMREFLLLDGPAETD